MTQVKWEKINPCPQGEDLSNYVHKAKHRAFTGAEVDYGRETSVCVGAFQVVFCSPWHVDSGSSVMTRRAQR
jgi:hypothetical protein